MSLSLLKQVMTLLSPITPSRHRRLRDKRCAPACSRGACRISQHSNLRPFLDRLTARSILSDQEKNHILQLPFLVKQPQPRQDFVALDQKVDHACFVATGLVGRFDQNSRGERQITALHIPGDMPDLHSVVQPTATSALQALASSTILEIPHKAIRSLAREHPAIAEAFWRDCMVDTMILAQWVVNLGRRQAKSRLAHLLCEMACRYKAVPVHGEVKFGLSMTQAQLAEATGLTPVHINRTLMRLAEIGTTFRNGEVRIADWPALIEIGDFDRFYLQDDIGPSDRVRIAR